MYIPEPILIQLRKHNTYLSWEIAGITNILIGVEYLIRMFDDGHTSANTRTRRGITESLNSLYGCWVEARREYLVQIVGVFSSEQYRMTDLFYSIIRIESIKRYKILISNSTIIQLLT